MASAWASTRICNQREFQEIFRKGRRKKGSRLTLFRLDRATAPSRLAVIVTKKTGTAVVRNRWKRVLREQFRSARAESGRHADFLVLVHRSVKGKPEERDRTAWANFLQRHM